MDVVERKMMLDLEIGLTKTKKMSKIVQSVELELKRMEDAIIWHAYHVNINGAGFVPGHIMVVIMIGGIL